MVTGGEGRIGVAFVKVAGMSAGGTERWMQQMAANLPAERYDVTYFWCEPPSKIGGHGRHGDLSEPARLDYLRSHGVRTVEFTVGAVDLRTAEMRWRDTDFWERFDPGGFDLVQTSKVGPPEYPFVRMPIPVVEQVAYNGGVDRSPAIAVSTHPSEWSRAWWWRRGGDLRRSGIVRIPVEAVSSRDSLRARLGIGSEELVVGFHQRRDDSTFSPIQLEAIASLSREDLHVVVLGGSFRYQEQAEALRLERVHFLEPTADPTEISAFLNTLDVFTHGRRDGETFGLALAEALAHGVPCLSHLSPGGANAQRETIGPGGHVATAGEYADLLEQLLADRDRRRVLADRGREHVRRAFGTDACVAQLEAAYERALGRTVPAQISYGAVGDRVLVRGDVTDPKSSAHRILVTGTGPVHLAGALAVSPPVAVDLHGVDWAVDAVAIGRSLPACRTTIWTSRSESPQVADILELNAADRLVHHAIDPATGPDPGTVVARIAFASEARELTVVRSRSGRLRVTPVGLRTRRGVLMAVRLLRSRLLEVARIRLASAARPYWRVRQQAIRRLRCLVAVGRATRQTSTKGSTSTYR